jgi:hypothetical protein
MADSNIFQMLRERILTSKGLPAAERRALLWFRNYTSELAAWQRQFSGNITYAKLASEREAFAKQIVSPSKARAGRLYFFMYSPEGFRTLPYYDRFPFILLLDKSPGHLLGLNFHYLDNLNRAKLFDALYTRARIPSATNPNAPLNSYINIDYDMLSSVKRFAAYRPCIRSYRINQMRSTMLHVGETEWVTALFLPVEMFKKSTRSEVWAESRKQLY